MRGRSRVTTPRLPARAATPAGPRQARPARQHTAFGQQLPHHTAPAGAERGAQRDLARPARGPRQQEVRDIGAPNEPDDADGAHQHPQRRLRLPVSRSCSGITVAVLRRFSILPRERVANGPHLRLRAREVHVSLELSRRPW